MVKIEDNISAELGRLGRQDVRAILLKSVKEGMDILRDRTKQLINQQGYKNPQKLTKKVKSIADSSVDEVIVSIFGSHLLRWIEKGTAERLTKKTRQYRGKMTGKYLFREARGACEPEVYAKIMESLEKNLFKNIK